jgi:hypothetical protein
MLENSPHTSNALVVLLITPILASRQRFVTLNVLVEKEIDTIMAH